MPFDMMVFKETTEQQLGSTFSITFLCSISGRWKIIAIITASIKRDSNPLSTTKNLVYAQKGPHMHYVIEGLISRRKKPRTGKVNSDIRNGLIFFLGCNFYINPKH